MFVRQLRIWLSLLAAIIFFTNDGRAQHFDIFLARPATGFQTIIGGADVDLLSYDDVTRVFEAELGAVAGEFIALEPGVNHPNIHDPGLTAYPSSAAGLQPGDLLRLRKREFTLNSSTSELFYWDGTGAVSFAPAVAGFRIDLGDPLPSTPGTGGTFDDHPFFVVDSDALAGIYLASVYGMVDGFDPSQPVYVVMGTIGLEDLHEKMELAAEYVHRTLVVPEPASLGLAAMACCVLAARLVRRRYAKERG